MDVGAGERGPQAGDLRGDAIEVVDVGGGAEAGRDGGQEVVVHGPDEASTRERASRRVLESDARRTGREAKPIARPSRVDGTCGYADRHEPSDPPRTGEAGQEGRSREGQEEGGPPGPHPRRAGAARGAPQGERGR